MQRTLSPHLAAALALAIATPAMAQVPPVPVPAGNPITADKALLGKMLFWDEQLSSDHTVACGTCHATEAGGGDARRGINPGFDGALGGPDDILGSPGVIAMDASTSYVGSDLFGDGPQITGRRSVNFFGALWSRFQFWDGRADDQFIDPLTGAVLLAVDASLENQALGPLLDGVEMAHAGASFAQLTTRLDSATPLALASSLTPDLTTALASGPTYPELFTSVFGDDAITPARIAMAIATYERTLVADETPFDAFMAGDNTAMTPDQVAGFNAFRGTTCDNCHRPPLFTDNSFRNVGLRPIEEDIGRQQVTGNAADAGRFKTPTLRNVGLSDRFMHNGQLQSLEEVVDFYIGVGAPQFRPNQDPLVRAVNLNPQERVDVVDFMRNALTDPRVEAGLPPFDTPGLHAVPNACSDGIDNDQDGLVDGDDGGCFSGSDTSETAHDQRCDDGIDNDNDGMVDLFDSDCDGTAPVDPDPAPDPVVDPEPPCDDDDLDGVCNADDLCIGDDATGDVDLDGTCDALDLVLVADPPRRRDPIRVEAAGAPPGAAVYFIVSTTGEGAGPCWGRSNVCADVLAPSVEGSATADAQGIAFILMDPDNDTRFVQAAWRTGPTGQTSNVVTLEPPTRPPRP